MAPPSLNSLRLSHSSSRQLLYGTLAVPSLHQPGPRWVRHELFPVGRPWTGNVLSLSPSPLQRSYVSESGTSGVPDGSGGKKNRREGRKKKQSQSSPADSSWRKKKVDGPARSLDPEEDPLTRELRHLISTNDYLKFEQIPAGVIEKHGEKIVKMAITRFNMEQEAFSRYTRTEKFMETLHQLGVMSHTVQALDSKRAEFDKEHGIQRSPPPGPQGKGAQSIPPGVAPGQGQPNSPDGPPNGPPGGPPNQEPEEDEADAISWWLIILILSIVAYIDITDRIEEDVAQEYAPPDQLWSEYSLLAFEQLPSRAVTTIWGKVANLAFPQSIQSQLNFLYLYFSGINLEDAAETDYREYPTLQSIFERTLAPEARPVDGDALLVSPVDAQVVHYGYIDPENITIAQVKGSDYPFPEFCGEESAFVQHYKETHNDPGQSPLYFVVLALLPKHYHAFHSPAEIDWKSREFIPGKAYPGTSWYMRRIPSLLVQNERVSLTGTWEHGFLSMIPVGSFLHSSIALSKTLMGSEADAISLETSASMPVVVTGKERTNSVVRDDQGSLFVDYTSRSVTPKTQRGEELGNFRMGSCVVLVFEAPPLVFTKRRSEFVSVGEPLAQLVTPEMARQQLEFLDRQREAIRLKESLEELEEMSHDEEYEDMIVKKTREVFETRRNKAKALERKKIEQKEKDLETETERLYGDGDDGKEKRSWWK